MAKFIKNLQKREVWPRKGKGDPVMKCRGLLFDPDKASLPRVNEACSRPAEPKREQAEVPANQTSIRPDLGFIFSLILL